MSYAGQMQRVKSAKVFPLHRRKPGAGFVAMAVLAREIDAGLNFFWAKRGGKPSRRAWEFGKGITA